MERVDDIDVRILQLLQGSGRMKRSEIAEDVGMSIPSVSDRMRKLEERGVITGYCAVVDAKRLRFDITAFIRVSIERSDHYGDFVEQAMSLPEVLEAHSITGDGSHILKIRTRDTTSLEKLLSQVQALPGVSGTSTSIVLSTFKESLTVPVEPVTLHGGT